MLTERMQPIALRPATHDDCVRVWQWNFDPSVRDMSRTKQGVSLAMHVQWFAARLNQPDPMWIVEEHYSPVGVVRIDSVDDVGRISIALERGVRGRGIGRRAIRLACCKWGRPVIAEVLAENAASRACFEACGFWPTEVSADRMIFRWEP